MVTERLPMRTIREILRQKWQLGQSNRAVARSVGLSVGAIGGTLHRARAAGLGNWAAIEAVSDEVLAARLYRRGDEAPSPGRNPIAPLFTPSAASLA